MFAFLQSSSATAVLSESLHTTASKSYFNFRASYGVAGLNLRTPCQRLPLFEPKGCVSDAFPLATCCMETVI